MKKIYSLIFWMCLMNFSFAQEPMKWTFSAKKINDKTYELHIMASIADEWFIYSQFNPTMGGPTPTTFNFINNPDLVIDKDKLKEDGVMEEKYDSIFRTKLKYYRNKVNFVKLITLKRAVKTIVNGTITFMGCNAEMCLPPQEVEFKIELK